MKSETILERLQDLKDRIESMKKEIEAKEEESDNNGLLTLERREEWHRTTKQWFVYKPIKGQQKGVGNIYLKKEICKEHPDQTEKDIVPPEQIDVTVKEIPKKDIIKPVGEKGKYKGRAKEIENDDETD